MAEQEPTLFKDEVDSKAVKMLGLALQEADPAFTLAKFQKAANRGLADLELKDRVRLLMATMTDHLPQDYQSALKVVVKAGLAQNKDGSPRVSGFAAWPLIDWIGVEGVDHPEISLAALRRLTHVFTGEFAIRPFLMQHTRLTLKTLDNWVDDEDHHVRRLISEGTRSRLPWGPQLPKFKKNPAAVIKLLEKLKDDESEYVRRSVANNLNDIAKDHPDRAAEVGARWMKKASVQRQKLVSHGLRTLVKQGHKGALAALGFEVEPLVKVKFAIDARTIALGDNLKIMAEIQSLSKVSQKLVVDFSIHYQKANGTLSAKIFKWKVLDLLPGQTVKLEKKQKFVSRSVRKLHLGKHEAEILVAGQSRGRKGFKLVAG